MIFKFYSIIKKSKINWINKLIKLLKIIYFFMTFDLNSLDNDILNNLNTEEKIIIGVLAFLCTGIALWTVIHDEDFKKKLDELDDYNDKWRRQK